MAVASVASHGEGHVNPFVEQILERRSGTSAAANENASNSAVAEDTFTPSTQSESAQSTAQAAGIFQLSQAATTANVAPAQTSPTSDSNGNSPSTAETAGANASAAAAQPGAGASAASSSTLAGATNIEEQGQVQAFNTELAALGLSNYDILQIDRIATAIQNFNPSAYTDLVNQFQRLAQESQQLTTPPPTPDGGSAPSAPAVANANAGTTIPVNVSGAQGTSNVSADNPGEPGLAVNTPPGSQLVQVQAPQQNSGASATNQPIS